MALLKSLRTASYTKNITISKTGNVCTERVDANGRDWMEFIEAQGRIPIDRYIDSADRGKPTEKNFMEFVRPDKRKWRAEQIAERRQAAQDAADAEQRMKPQSKAEDRFAESFVRMTNAAAAKVALEPAAKGK